ncbi:Aste57867_3724 [Aphanomyces stellatus]|uniref:Aste57867_3724 protein n=1 Tax=Aphanomyces stellatus TaxID=120398 RepID=A0A485KFP9_9STRA|nr:hypothetical protein As57867_003713 [Aphanomyces stellatus]VFT80877.1 Aste57867_3724 [Aphanomyces stellatus]
MLRHSLDHSDGLRTSVAVATNGSPISFHLASPFGAGNFSPVSIIVYHGDDEDVATSESASTCVRVGAAVGVAMLVLVILTLSLKSPLVATSAPSIATTSSPPSTTTTQQTTSSPPSIMSTGLNVTRRINDNVNRTDDNPPPKPTTVKQNSLVTNEPGQNATPSPPATAPPPLSWSNASMVDAAPPTREPRSPTTINVQPAATDRITKLETSLSPTVSPSITLRTSRIPSPSIGIAPPSPTMKSPSPDTSLPSMPSTEKNVTILPSPSDGTIGYRVQSNCDRSLTIQSIVDNANEANSVRQEHVLATGGFLDLAHVVGVVLGPVATSPLTFEATAADDCILYRLRPNESLVTRGPQLSVSVTILTNGVQNESCQNIYCRDAQCSASLTAPSQPFDLHKCPAKTMFLVTFC